MGNKNFDWAEWERWEAEAAKPTPAAQAPTVTNIYVLNVDASINIQAVVNPGNTPALLTDNRQRLNNQGDCLWRYLPPNYHPTNMDVLEAEIRDNPNYGYKPLTKEELAGIAGRGW
jgi:hypothetical protein